METNNEKNNIFLLACTIKINAMQREFFPRVRSTDTYRNTISNVLIPCIGKNHHTINFTQCVSLNPLFHRTVSYKSKTSKKYKITDPSGEVYLDYSESIFRKIAMFRYIDLTTMLKRNFYELLQEVPLDEAYYQMQENNSRAHNYLLKKDRKYYKGFIEWQKKYDPKNIKLRLMDKITEKLFYNGSGDDEEKERDY